jgi:hypothetical protein
MAVFEDLATELCGLIPGYSIYLAEKATARSWQRILRERSWNFLIAEGAFNAPPLVQGGTVGVTQNSITVTVSPAADAILNPLVTAVPPLTQRQFRLQFGTPLYNIVTYNHAGLTMTLDRPYLEPTNATATYLVYQCYFFPPPQALLTSGLYDFNRWISVLDMANGYTLGVVKDKAWVDRRDPQRTNADLAYEIVEYKVDALGNTLWELWPHPVQGQIFNVIYKKKGFAVQTGAEVIPDIISDDLILNYALYRYGYPWAATNAGRDPNLQKVNWTAQQQLAKRDWDTDLQKAKLEDDNINLQSLLPSLSLHAMVGPIDSSFIQGHDMTTFPR